MKTPPSGWLLACALGAQAWAADASPSLLERVTLDLRARHEHAEQSGLRDSDALTLRARLGLVTSAWHGWQAGVEAEHIASPAGDDYNQSGLNPGGAGRVVIADPEGTEINQAYARHTAGSSVLTLGRQRLVLDQARFVGDVGWRQNAQTYDAVAWSGRPHRVLALTAAYLGRVNRVLGDRHPQGNWDSKSFLVHGTWSTRTAGIKAATYAYLLDFPNAAAQGNATYGLALSGTTKPGTGATVIGRAEYARQTDYGKSPLSYATDYAGAELGLGFAPGTLALGGEWLGSDTGTAFRTPLATLHAFNGWADVFTTTPGDGLQDVYVKANVTLPAAVKATLRHHWFEARRRGAVYGREWDAQLSRAFRGSVIATMKYARFAPAEGARYSQIEKIWIQLEFIR